MLSPSINSGHACRSVILTKTKFNWLNTLWLAQGERSCYDISEDIFVKRHTIPFIESFFLFNKFINLFITPCHSQFFSGDTFYIGCVTFKPFNLIFQ